MPSQAFINLHWGGQVKTLRQIEMAQLMVSANNFTHAYARALLVGTPADQLVNPEQKKKVPGHTAEDVARMEKEMEVLEREFRGCRTTSAQTPCISALCSGTSGGCCWKTQR
jgi:hypothetical protein